MPKPHAPRHRRQQPSRIDQPPLLAKACELAPPTGGGSAIDDLPMYNPDLDGPAARDRATLHRRGRSLPAMLFATPEHNRSIRAC